jgi:hypothetical protein
MENKNKIKSGLNEGISKFQPEILYLGYKCIIA